MPAKNTKKNAKEITKETEKETKETKETKEITKENSKPAKYYESVGRRKRAVARIRLFTRGDKDFLVNKRPFVQYFPTDELQNLAGGALKKMKVMDKFRITAVVRGGGSSGQAEAVRHGISRALMKFNADFRKRLKRAGFLTRDPRETERKKFGLKKARRAPQWSKR